jgi:hypothetical protein
LIFMDLGFLRNEFRGESQAYSISKTGLLQWKTAHPDGQTARVGRVALKSLSCSAGWEHLVIADIFSLVTSVLLLGARQNSLRGSTREALRACSRRQRRHSVGKGVALRPPPYPLSQAFSLKANVPAPPAARAGAGYRWTSYTETAKTPKNRRRRRFVSYARPIRAGPLAKSLGRWVAPRDTARTRRRGRLRYVAQASSTRSSAGVPPAVPTLSTAPAIRGSTCSNCPMGCASQGASGGAGAIRGPGARRELSCLY